MSSGRSEQASRLLQSLKDVVHTNLTLMGQYDLDECEFVRNVVGEYPVIRGIDFMNYSPKHVQFAGQPASSEIDSYIRDARDHGFVYTASWHWSPSLDGVDSGNYYNAFYKMDFDPLSHMDAIMSDIDAIAEPLKKFRDAGIPVLWRPIHECTQYAWFWWSKDANTFKTIYRNMYDRLTNAHGLTNLLWVWNPAHNYNFYDDNNSFYPGDDVVDVVAIDYPSDVSSSFQGMQRVAPNKVYAVAEFSVSDGVRYLDNYWSAPWSFMVAWSRDQGPMKAGWDAVRQLYQHQRAKSQPWSGF